MHISKREFPAKVASLAVSLFRGGYTKTVPLTVLSQRAGLVMNPGAKVKLLGVPVGHVASIETRQRAGRYPS